MVHLVLTPWEFQKGEEQNPNFGKKGEHCISEEALGMAFTEELPGKRYTRGVKSIAQHGGKPETEIDGGNFERVDPYMKKDGIITKKSGTPAKNMTEAECKAYATSIGKPWSTTISGQANDKWENYIKGCQEDSTNVYWNPSTTSTIECGHNGNICIEKGPGGAGYTKYCPVDALLNPEGVSLDEIDMTDSGLGNQEKCYRPGADAGVGRDFKYTVKELEDEAKSRFVRDNELPTYTSTDRKTEHRILGPGSREIYRFKVKTEAIPEKYGGLTSGLWHEKKENFGDVSWMSLIQN